MIDRCWFVDKADDKTKDAAQKGIDKARNAADASHDKTHEKLDQAQDAVNDDRSFVQQAKDGVVAAASVVGST